MSASIPTITLTYLGVLGLLYAGLALAVVFFRAKFDVPYGDDGNLMLHRSVRAHGNFQEWVPLIGLLVAGLEMSGESVTAIHLLMGSLLLARLLHALAIYSPVGSRVYMVGRITGALTTWLVLIVSSVMLLLSA